MRPDQLARAVRGQPDDGRLVFGPDRGPAGRVSQVVAAGHWAAAHPREAVAYIGRETDASSEWVRYGYGASVHQRLQTSLDDSAIAGLKAFKDFLLRHGFLAADFSVNDWIDPAPLAALARLHPRTGT